MNLEHVTAFTAAMQRKDLEAMVSHMAGDVVLNTPLMAGPSWARRQSEGSSALCWQWSTRSTSGKSCRDPNTCLRFLRSLAGQSSWTVWIIGASIVLD
jgi:hypothetical protein